ncbi:hypothetical protein GIB67_000980 [Kingdonia uniflora]|uniref:HMA domain-containing protein n=1 Tax=Kingdonia uniflora TaxID=39325 RepID=A0A7J7MFV8_9MAGN|nr:hypothetical protein GIB67_000980 [Kingdonia uniflora]
MALKISTLVLKVDLECTKCYNKIRRAICKFHREIYSHSYDFKENTVTITGSFDPNKFANTLRCYAGKVIKSIEIKEPEKPKPASSNPEPAKPSPPPKEVVASKPAPPKAAEPVPKALEPAPAPNIVVPIYVQGFPTPYPTPYPVPMRPIYEGYARPPPSYNSYGRQHCYCGCEDNYRRSSCCEYVNEENPAICTIM